LSSRNFGWPHQSDEWTTYCRVGPRGDVFLLAGVAPSTLSALAVPPAAFTAAVASGLRAAQQVITVSEELRDICVNRLGVCEKRAQFMAHGIDLGRFDYRVDGAKIRAEQGIAPEVGVVLFTGRLSREKGVSRLIEAMPPFWHASRRRGFLL
jgi:glycosyltransferase involved in cell wall biosynthesis